ncbi:MAG: reverse transcriptase-like protein [Candidatus Saccharimonadales bacterium]
MKQKVVVRAIIKQDGKVLLLRRKGGRPSIAKLYELPGGRVHINQQPEDAARRSLEVHIGAQVSTVHLDDVLTYIDPDDRELQYTFIVYRVALSETERTIKLSDEYDKYVWKSLSDIQLDEITQSTQQLLKLVPTSFSRPGDMISTSVNDVKISTFEKLIAYSDGGSRGNPGPSASGFVLLDERSQIVYEGGSFLGHTTNNVAEYTAVLEALDMAKNFGARIVDMRMDSQLVANQMNGIYKIKNPDLSLIHHRIKELSTEFDKVSYSYVARAYNKLADGMVNKILDAHS